MRIPSFVCYSPTLSLEGRSDTTVTKLTCDRWVQSNTSMTRASPVPGWAIRATRVFDESFGRIISIKSPAAAHCSIRSVP